MVVRVNVGSGEGVEVSVEVAYGVAVGWGAGAVWLGMASVVVAGVAEGDDGAQAEIKVSARRKPRKNTRFLPVWQRIIRATGSRSDKGAKPALRQVLVPPKRKFLTQ